METFFMQTPMGQYLAQKEADFFRRHLQYLNGQVAVQLGGIWQRPSENGKPVFRRPDVFLKTGKNVVFKTHTNSAKSNRLKNKKPILENNPYSHVDFEPADYRILYSDYCIKPFLNTQ